MMNDTEHLLTVLAEECSETAQRATKAIRFGLTEVQPEQSEDNRRRLEREYSEIVAVAELLGLKVREEDKAVKRAKLVKYMDYARQIGTLEPAVLATRKCERCEVLLPPDHRAVYCSNECAAADF